MHKFTPFWNFIIRRVTLISCNKTRLSIQLSFILSCYSPSTCFIINIPAQFESPNVELIGIFYGSAVIKDWTLSAPYSHLAGGMKYKDGKLTVPIPGRYYIYQQIYWRGYRGKPIRISILLNNKVIAMAHPPVNALRRDEFTISTGGVFYLKAGDVITVVAGGPGIAYMYTHHSFYGAFLI